MGQIPPPPRNASHTLDTLKPQPVAPVLVWQCGYCGNRWPRDTYTCPTCGGHERRLRHE
jgi:rubrerythrin